MYTFGITRELRLILLDTWKCIVRDCNLRHMPEELLDKYQNIYREIVGELIYLHSSRDTGKPKRMWSFIDLHNHSMSLCGDHGAYPDEISEASNAGCSIATDIMRDYGVATDDGNDEEVDEVDDMFDEAVGMSIYAVFADGAAFYDIDEELHYQLVIPETILDGAYIILNDKYTKVHIGSDMDRFL